MSIVNRVKEALMFDYPTYVNFKAVFIMPNRFEPMRNCRALLAALILPFTAQAQNLVSNPGFEQLNACPITIGAIEYDAGFTTFPYVKDWISGTPVPGSPDLMNKCASFGSDVHVPESGFGYQHARTGDGFAGLIAWGATKSGSGWTGDFREYLQTKLLQPLLAGKKYCVTFFVNNAVTSDASNPKSYYNFVGIEQFGVNLSVSKPVPAPATPPASGTVLHLAPQIVNTPGTYITDTTGWVKISSVYTATGGEQWLTLGCFTNGAPNMVQVSPQVPDPLKGNYRCYLYVDDVSVVNINSDDTVTQVIDSIPCTKDNFSMQLVTQGYEDIKWSTGATSADITVATTGKYWCISRYNCQVHIDTFNVRYDPAKTLNLGRDTGNCENMPLTLRSTPGFSNHVWNTGETTDFITVTKSGRYILTAANECGLQKDTIDVFIEPPTAAPVVSDTVICQFVERPVIKVKGSNINWYTHHNGIYGYPHQPEITTFSPAQFSFFVTQTAGKCESEKVPVNIKVMYTPHKELPELDTMCEKFRDSIGVYRADVDYKWNNGDFMCCMIPERDGLFKVSMTNQCGSFVDSTRVIFSLCEDCLAVPNAFTPNNDGSNDQFRAIVKCPVENFRMRIFNRWGQPVFDAKDVNKTWSGISNNLMCDQGVYVYIIEYTPATTRQTKVVKGNVTLLR